MFPDNYVKIQKPSRVLSTGGGRGEASPLTAQLPPPPPPKWFASDSTYHIRVALLSSIMPVLITRVAF